MKRDAPRDKTPAKRNILSATAAIYGRLAGFLGLSFYSFDFTRFLRMHSLYNVGTGLSSVFVSTFFLKAGGSFNVVCLFYLCTFLCEAAGITVAAGMAMRRRVTTMTRIGLILFTGYYLLLLLAPDLSLRFFPVAAALTGLGNAFYWIPYHNYCVSYTHSGNRQKAISLMGMMGNFIVLVAPLLSGLITSKMPGSNGYMVIFAVSVTALLGAFLTTRGMPAQPLGRKGNPMISLLFREFKERAVHCMSLSHVFYGIRDGAYMYYLNILIFNIVKSELVVGINVSARSVAALLVWMALGRLLRPARRAQWHFAVVGAGLALSAVLLLLPAAPVIMTVYIADAVFQSVSYNTLQFSAYELSDFLSRGGVNRRPDTICLRNFSLNMGRCAGLLLFMLLPAEETAVWPLLLLNTLALPSAFFTSRMQTAIAASGEGEAA